MKQRCCLFPINFNCSPNPNTLLSRWNHFSVSLIIGLHLHLSSALALSLFHLDYTSILLQLQLLPLKQLRIVTMVTHTTTPSPSLLSSLRTIVDVEIVGPLPIFWSRPDLHNVKNAVDAERRRAGCVSRSIEKWSADVKFSNWKKKNGNKVTGKVRVCMCFRTCVSCLLPGVFNHFFLTTSIDRYFFLPPPLL